MTIHNALKYLRERQPPVVRFFHVTILCLVLSQIIISNFMGFTHAGDISNKTIEGYATWIHIGTGLLLLPLVGAFIYIELKRHGFKYFFPYFFGHFGQLKKDIQQFMHFQLPEANAYGMAAIVQGLGLGALILVILSGLSWFLSWSYMPPLASSTKALHQLLTGLIEAYVIGHGGMGLLHLFFNMKGFNKG